MGVLRIRGIKYHHMYHLKGVAFKRHPETARDVNFASRFDLSGIEGLQEMQGDVEMAEEERFELSDGFPSAVFKTAALSRSATPPQ